MKTRISSRLASLYAAALLVAGAGAHAGVGIRVMAQDWNPAQPAQQSTRRLVDEPALVSDALQRAWRDARPRLCTALSNRMGLGGAAHGFTLRDIDCVLDETPVFSVASNGPNGLTALMAFGGYVAATSTTPDHFDKALDPRFSINVRMNLALRISVQPSPTQTLRADAASVTLSDARLDSHGLSGDILKFVISDLAAFFTGTDYKQLAESAINGVGADIARPFNAALAPVNDRLRPPSGLVRVGVWARPDLIAVAFAPQPMTPPSNGSLSGVFRWGAGQSPGRCDGLSLAASVQTGPAPLTGVDGRFDVAYAPRKALGDFRLEGTGPAGECRYRITGLAAGWQNDLVAKGRTDVAQVAVVHNGPTRYRTTLQGDGWDGVHVTPLPSAERHYVVVTAPLAGAALDPEIAANRSTPRVVGRGPSPGDRIGAESSVPLAALPATIGPMVSTTTTAQKNAVAPGRSWVAPATTATPVAGSIRARQGAANRLNPQPLPPEPPPERAPSAFRR